MVCVFLKDLSDILKNILHLFGSFCNEVQFSMSAITTNLLISSINEYEDASSTYMRVYPKVSRLAAWSENCKWYSSLQLDAIVSLFCESA
jgi:L-ribulose-5-phosphate 3-epimerase UlaE